MTEPTPLSVEDVIVELTQALLELVNDGWSSGSARRAMVRRAAALAWLDRERAKPSLGAAWKAAEEALPEGWCDLSVYHYDPEPGDAHEPGHYGARTGDPANGAMTYGYGPTPAAALLALAARLAASR